MDVSGWSLSTTASLNTTEITNVSVCSSCKGDFVNHLIVLMYSETSTAEKLMAARAVRRELARPTMGEAEIEQLLETGVMEELVQLLGRRDDETGPLCYEIMWILTNVASGKSEHAMAVASSGAIQELNAVLESAMPAGIPDFYEQAVWALGNLVGDGAVIRDMALQCGAEKTVLALLREAANDDQAQSASQIRNELWCLGNLFRHGDFDGVEELSEKVLAISVTMFDVWAQQEYILQSLCWTIHFTALSGNVAIIEQIIRKGSFTHILATLESPANHLRSVAAIVVADLLRGTVAQRERMAACENGKLLRLIGENLARADTRTQKMLWESALCLTEEPTKKTVKCMLDCGFLKPSTTETRVAHSRVSDCIQALWQLCIAAESFQLSLDDYLDESQLWQIIVRALNPRCSYECWDASLKLAELTLKQKRRPRGYQAAVVKSSLCQASYCTNPWQLVDHALFLLETYEL